MKLEVELRDEKINGLQRELEELQLGGTSEVSSVARVLVQAGLRIRLRIRIQQIR